MKPHAPYFGEREFMMIELAEQLSLPNMHGELTKGLHERLSKCHSDEDIYQLGTGARSSPV